MSLLSRIEVYLVTLFAYFFSQSSFAGLFLPNSPKSDLELYKNHHVDPHMLAFIVCVAIGIVVFGILLITLIKFRKTKDKNLVSHHFHKNLGVEILWTVIPFIMLVGMLIPASIKMYWCHL